MSTPIVGSLWRDETGQKYRVEGVLEHKGEAYVRLTQPIGTWFSIQDFGTRLTEAK